MVVPHGVPDAVHPEPDAIAGARRRHGVDERPYVVYPAITHPHKGHGVLVDMLEHLDDVTAVVLIGGCGSAEEDLARAIEASPHHASRRSGQDACQRVGS